MRPVKGMRSIFCKKRTATEVTKFDKNEFKRWCVLFKKTNWKKAVTKTKKAKKLVELLIVLEALFHNTNMQNFTVRVKNCFELQIINFY